MSRAIKVEESCFNCLVYKYENCQTRFHFHGLGFPPDCPLPPWPSLSRRDIEDWARLSGTIDSLIIKLKSIGIEVKEARDENK